MASALIPEADRQVLLALLRTDAAVSGRALARMTGLSQPTAQRALVRLREQGLVMAESAPPALLYRANQDHLAMPALVDLPLGDDGGTGGDGEEEQLLHRFRPSGVAAGWA